MWQQVFLTRIETIPHQLFITFVVFGSFVELLHLESRLQGIGRLARCVGRISPLWRKTQRDIVAKVSEAVPLLVSSADEEPAD